MSNHHLGVWAATISCAVLMRFRLVKKRRIGQRGQKIFLAGMCFWGASMVGGGCSGQGSLMANETEHLPVFSTSIPAAGTPEQTEQPGDGRKLFLKNCAHCHGPDGHGEEGPDLHNLDWTDEEIATRIRNGKKGQMTAFAGKLSPENIRDLIAYLRTLK
jgi:mono/diheme cytochrome c family protein